MDPGPGLNGLQSAPARSWKVGVGCVHRMETVEGKQRAFHFTPTRGRQPPSIILCSAFPQAVRPDSVVVELCKSRSAALAAQPLALVEQQQQQQQQQQHQQQNEAARSSGSGSDTDDGADRKASGLGTSTSSTSSSGTSGTSGSGTSTSTSTSGTSSSGNSASAPPGAYINPMNLGGGGGSAGGGAGFAGAVARSVSLGGQSALLLRVLLAGLAKRTAGGPCEVMEAVHCALCALYRHEGNDPAACTGSAQLTCSYAVSNTTAGNAGLTTADLARHSTHLTRTPKSQRAILLLPPVHPLLHRFTRLAGCGGRRRVRGGPGGGGCGGCPGGAGGPASGNHAEPGLGGAGAAHTEGGAVCGPAEGRGGLAAAGGRGCA